MCHVAKGMTTFDLRPRLGSIRAPSLIVSGECDRLFRPEFGEEISRGIAGSTYSAIPGAGHLSSLDSPHHFNRLLVDFLAAHFSVV